MSPLKPTALILFLALLVSACATEEAADVTENDGWTTTFFDDFDTFNTDNWQDQILWVNNEDQCYLRDGAMGTREVSDGTLKVRVIDLENPSSATT